LPSGSRTRWPKLASFDLAIPTILTNEGGYVNNVSDPGGETNFGISKRSYPDLDIRNLTREDATEIYRRDFWKFDGISSQPVATKVLDTCVNLGQVDGMRLCQKAVGVNPDGQYGPNTEGAFNGSPEVLDQIRSQLIQHYENWISANPAREQFRAGLMRRARE